MKQAVIAAALVLLPALSPGQTDGALDLTFDPLLGANGDVHALVLQPDGRIIIGGEFTTYNNIPRVRIARIHADGSLDESFDPGAGVYGSWTFPDVDAIALQPDGRILIGGQFTQVDGTMRYNIARLHADGSVDTSFDPGLGADYWVGDIALQPDGRIIAVGEFTSFNSVDRVRVVRLHPDGSVDATFDPGVGPSNSVYDVEIQPDGRILLAGAFNGFGLTARRSLARLHVDGTLDVSFDPGVSTGNDGFVTDLALQPDSMIIIAGTFTSYTGVARGHLARIHTDGSLDAGFATLAGASQQVAALALQPDGKLLIGGGFYTYNGTSRRFIARVHADGTLDTGFDPGSGAYGDVYVIHLAPDDKVMLGGRFTSYNGTPRARVARLHNAIVGLAEHRGEDALMLYPNPASGIVKVEVPMIGEPWTVVFRDQLGHVVRTEQWNGPSATIECPSAAGIYCVSVMSGRTARSGRLVVVD